MTDNRILISRAEVEELVGIRRSALYRLMSEGSFPLPVKINQHSVRWRKNEVLDWINSRPRATGEIKADAA